MSMRIAITAAAVRTALGDSADEVWRAIQDGKSAVGPIQGFDASGFGDVQAAQIWKEPETAEDDPALRILGPHGRLLGAVAMEAHAAAGLASFPREQVGLFVGMGMVDSPIDDLKAAALASRDGGKAMDMASFFAGKYRQIHPLWPLSMLNNVAVGQTAIDLDIRGDNAVFAADGAAGIRAILEAAHAVREGSCRAALASGVSCRIGPASLARMQLRDGRHATPGEGGAAVVLEGEEGARARGASIIGYVRDGGTRYVALHDQATRVMKLLDLTMGGAEPGPDLHAHVGDLGPAHAPAAIALGLASWSAQPHPRGGAVRRLLVQCGTGDTIGALLIEEAA